MTFEEFKLARYCEPPYDNPNNTFGFARPAGSDISAHLPFLQFLASACNVVVEFGVRDCYSTSAFIAGCPNTVESYDIDIRPAVEILRSLKLPCTWKFHHQSSIDPKLVINECELLFLDTLHTYEQVKEELRLHHERVTRWIAFHDTFSFPEINQAIIEFMQDHPEWKPVYEVKFNHGLTLLEKDVP